jgi:dUTP pyrophosphatase
MVQIKIKKLSDEAVVPKYAKEGDAGLDLVAISKRETEKFIEYGTGLAFEIPLGYAGFIFPRSSVSKKDLVLANSVGVVDSGYRGEFLVRFKKLGEEEYEVGERVAQVVIMKLPEVEIEEVLELSNSERGEGGFGSTGLN